MRAPDMVLITAGAQAAAIGVSRWTVQAMRKAGKELNDPLPVYAMRSQLIAWLRRHPEFRGSHYLGKKPKHLCSA